MRTFITLTSVLFSSGERDKSEEGKEKKKVVISGCFFLFISKIERDLERITEDED